MMPNTSNESVTLAPSFQLPSILSIIGLLLLPLPLSPWLTIIVTSFGLFLLLQSFTLRLEFTKDSLIVKQFGKQLRSFPFKNWLAWKIFLPQLPGLLYFREEASPHLLPILFDPKELKTQLELRVSTLEIKQN
tara:strand:+ start:80 stop:478 length:399 start_codon:yes stop_codon:yes gene_type:complete